VCLIKYYAIKAYEGVDVYTHTFLLSAGQLHAPAALPPGKEPRYPLDKRLGGPQSRSGRHREEKILDPTGTRLSGPSVIQPVASRYTDYAIPAHRKYLIILLLITLQP
jgi:hypothetical protein